MTDDTHHGAITDAIEALEVNIIFTNTLREYFYESKDTVKALGAWHLYENNKKTLAKLQELKDAVPVHLEDDLEVLAKPAMLSSVQQKSSYLAAKILHEAVED